MMSSSNLQSYKHKIIDLRSDTLTSPTPEMRRAMFEAEVGDDGFGEDPTVKKLEKRVTDLFKMEAAIFLPTTCMGNAVAVLTHCDRRGREILTGDLSHIFLYEQGAPAQLGGVHTRTVPNLPDGTFDLSVLEKSIRDDRENSPVTGLVVVENTHNECGGKVLPLEWLNKLTKLTKKYGIPVHMDGARVFNAAAYLGVPVSEITRNLDSVVFCFTKGLGAPFGSMLVGSQEFIRRARRLRKVLGAGMTQVGVVAAPCLVALDTMPGLLHLDHRRTNEIAKGIAECKGDYFKVDLEGLDTNIIMIYVNPDVFSAATFCSRLSQVTEDEQQALGTDASIVRVLARSSAMARIVVYWEITDEDVSRVVKKFAYIAQEIKAKHKTGEDACQ